MALPPLTEAGELPEGVHPAPLNEVRARFGVGSARRTALILRLERIYRVAQATGHLARILVFGSFVTSKPEPQDVDLFLVMTDTFDASELMGDMRLLFDHGCSFRSKRILDPRPGSVARRTSRGGILASEAGRRPAGHSRDHQGGGMIADDHELNAALERIRHLQGQVVHLRQVETNPANYHLSASGFLAEIDRMQLEVREYLSLHPGELKASA